MAKNGFIINKEKIEHGKWHEIKCKTYRHNLVCGLRLGTQIKQHTQYDKLYNEKVEY